MEENQPDIILIGGPGPELAATLLILSAMPGIIVHAQANEPPEWQKIKDRTPPIIQMMEIKGYGPTANNRAARRREKRMRLKYNF